MAITFNKADKIILVEAPATEVLIQDLVNAIRDFEDEWYGMDEASLTNAYGKQGLGGGVSVGITVELINNWRVKFADRAGPEWINCYIRGGNIVAINDYGNDPIVSSAFVNVIIAQSTSPSLISIDAVADAVWDEATAEHMASATFGAKGQKAVPSETIEDYRADVTGLAIESGGRLENVESLTAFIHNIEGGRWKIDGTQMIFYKADNITEIARFNLYKAGEIPSDKDVVDRRRA